MSRANILLEAESFTTVDESQVSDTTKEKSQTENGVYVKGMALPFGKTSRNGVQYEKGSVKEAHGDLVGRTMLFNHKEDFVTGHILNTEVTEDGMFFEGDINPNAEMPNGVSVADAIERGDINSVSIQAFVEQLGEEADENGIVEDMDTEKVAVRDFLEISCVSIPGFPQAEAMPEHLKHQGVKPVTELIGPNQTMEEQESDDTEDEEIKDEAFEFRPVPSHVLYSDEEDAKQRARNLGLQDIHEHEMSGQIYYMAGDNHEEWVQAVDKEDATEDIENDSFAGYDDWDACIQDNQEKDDPEAFCGELKARTEELENDTMSENNSTENDTDENKENQDNNTEQATDQNFEQFVAAHMEGAETEDVTEALAEYNFTGLDQSEVAALLANEFDLSTETVMDAIAALEDMENNEEGDYSDDEDEEENEGSGEEENTDTEEEMKERIDELEKRNDELADRLESIIENDEGKSKQGGPSKEDKSSIKNRGIFS